jgi:signal transduction histidine kinase
MKDRPLLDPEASREAALVAPGLVHELRHPLLGLKAGLAFVAGALGGKVSGLDDWALVQDQVARIEEILESYGELLDGGPARACVFDPLAAVRRAGDLLRFRVRPLGARFAIVADAPVPPAFGSPRALLHATVNLVANAVDAVDPERGRVEVRVTIGPTGAPQVRVADDGCGIAPSDAERIFAPGFTTKEPGKGTGLGLAIARRMVEGAGGRLRLDRAGAAEPWARTAFAVDLARPPEVP